ncbi:hypothetical protein CPLU01_01407 [Colletotrichum plurivorum]|uniref:Uncharacterized protein n=1 Tax=Colletotrichum plurivorum TaxID=2175906 RepID=A0A8H6NPD3_9PEZI|nr:hypothetical protein CPLU01_01407 [Colletotrichum plurivorum]
MSACRSQPLFITTQPTAGVGSRLQLKTASFNPTTGRGRNDIAVSSNSLGRFSFVTFRSLGRRSISTQETRSVS